MPTTVTGVNPGIFNNQIAAPVATEFVTGASVQLVAQGAADQDKYLNDRIDAARVVLSDADHTLDLSNGWRYQLPENPAAMRVISMPASAPSYNAI